MINISAAVVARRRRVVKTQTLDADEAKQRLMLEVEEVRVTETERVPVVLVVIP
jgi:hypothetical protein